MDHCAPGRARAVHEDTKGHAPGRSRHDALRRERDWSPIRAASAGRATPTADELHHPTGVGQAGLAFWQADHRRARALPGVLRQLHRHSTAISDQQLEPLSAGVDWRSRGRSTPASARRRSWPSVRRRGSGARERARQAGLRTRRALLDRRSSAFSLTPTRSVSIRPRTELRDLIRPRPRAPMRWRSPPRSCRTSSPTERSPINRTTVDGLESTSRRRRSGHPGYTSKLGLYTTRSSLLRRDDFEVSKRCFWTRATYASGSRRRSSRISRSRSVSSSLVAIADHARELRQ